MPRGRPKKNTEINNTTELQEIAIPDVANLTLDNFKFSAEIVAGQLTSNAEVLKDLVLKELENYKVENYLNDPDKAKKDKAVLNNVLKTISDKRKEVTKEWNKPLDEFSETMKTLERTVDSASKELKKITDEVERIEKETKRKQIEDFYSTLDFKIVSLDKIFNSQWLNKTYKMTEIMKDIESITEKISTEIDVIKQLKSVDEELLLAEYLETLSLQQVLNKARFMEESRKKLQEVNLIKESENKEPVQAQQFTQKNTNIIEEKLLVFRLEIKGTEKQLYALRKFIDDNNIEYTKI